MAAVSAAVAASRTAGLLHPGARRGRRRVAGRAAETAADTAAEARTSSLGGRVKAWWQKNAKLDRKQMSKLGLACLLSYGFISNASYILCLYAAVYSAMKATGASPLADRAALKQFGLAYAGFWMFLNVVRPLRFALAMALSPAFDRLVSGIQRGLKCERPRAVAVTVFLVNVLGTFSLLFGGLFLVSAVCDVPLDVSQLGTLIKAGKAAKDAAA